MQKAENIYKTVKSWRTYTNIQQAHMLHQLKEKCVHAIRKQQQYIHMHYGSCTGIIWQYNNT